MAIDERLLKILQKRLGYNDEETKKFAENGRNEELLSLQKELANKTIVLEVVESKGCNSMHKVGDKFHFDAVGNILTRQCPEKICTFSLNAASNMLYAASELLYAGADPNKMRFRRSSCFDVGIECGGWGRIVLELSVVDKQQTAKL